MQRDNFIIVSGTIISLYHQSPNLLIHFGNIETGEIYSIEMPVSYEFMSDINGSRVPDFDDIVYKYILENKDKVKDCDYVDLNLNSAWELDKSVSSFLKPFKRQDKINSILDEED